MNHLRLHDGLPILDWEATQSWIAALPQPAAVSAETDCKRGWLLHLRDALGGEYELHESDHALLLATCETRAARAMLDFIHRTRRRIGTALEGLIAPDEHRPEILILFGDDETYYRYVSHAYPADGEFAFSGGMFLHAGCPHFVTTRAETQTVERVIAHEMTHASVSHLPIPLWLNEGLAVNVENRLMGAMPKLFTPAETREKHVAFWSVQTIQEFWSGQSFARPDDGNMLSYDLAQVMVEILAGRWQPFCSFARAATYEDAGAAAANQHLDIQLGNWVSSILDQPSSEGWQPDPQKWRDVSHTPE